MLSSPGNNKNATFACNDCLQASSTSVVDAHAATVTVIQRDSVRGINAAVQLCKEKLFKRATARSHHAASLKSAALHNQLITPAVQ
jgi:hypothetical protein